MTPGQILTSSHVFMWFTSGMDASDEEHRWSYGHCGYIALGDHTYLHTKTGFCTSQKVSFKNETSAFIAVCPFFFYFLLPDSVPSPKTFGCHSPSPGPCVPALRHFISPSVLIPDFCPLARSSLCVLLMRLCLTLFVFVYLLRPSKKPSNVFIVSILSSSLEPQFLETLRHSSRIEPTNSKHQSRRPTPFSLLFRHFWALYFSEHWVFGCQISHLWD